MLSPEMLADLERSGLDAEDAKLMQLEELTAEQCEGLCGRAIAQGRSGYKIPYFDLHGKPNGLYRIRFLGQPVGGFAVDPKDVIKYWQPPGTSPGLYLAPFVDWQSVMATTDPLNYTEGEKKAALACKQQKYVIGLGGVWAFKSKGTGQFFVLDEIKAINHEGRDVTIIFDSDVVTKPQVMGAMHEFARQLSNLGARPSTAILPSGGQEKVGLDDYLVAGGKWETIPREGFAEIEALWELNKDYAIIKDLARVMDLRTEKTITADTFIKVTEAPKKIIRVDAKGNPKVVQAAPAWMQWEGRRTHFKLVYEPGQPRVLPNSNYNLWRGYKFEPRKGEISNWIYLLDHLFPPGEYDAERHWFEQWCAYPFQYPGTKIHSAPVFFGRMQGSGKSMTGEVLLNIYGENASEINKKSLQSDFNGWAARRQFCLCNEITDRKDLRLDSDDLKTIITRKEVQINDKYVPQYSTLDCCNYYFTSNYYSALYMSDQDRRYFVHKVERKIPEAKLVELSKWVNGDLSAVLYHFMYEVDTTGFVPKSPALETRDREVMIEAGRSDLDRWVTDLKADPMPLLRQNADNFRERDLWRIEELVAAAKIHFGTSSITHHALRNALIQVAMFDVTKRVKTRYGTVELFILRNADKWKHASPEELAEAYDAGLKKGVKY